MMTLEVCYAEMGADYAEVLERLRDERLIRRYVLRFPDDPSYDALCRAMSGGRLEEAFLAAHTLKGITQSLGFGGLCASTSALTEALRNGARGGGGPPAAIGNSGLPPNRGQYSPVSG
ncbi:MAG: Hpt domain-containing protein [Intestinimonas sp.]